MRISDIKIKVKDGSNKKFKELSFLVYGLGLSGKSVVNYFKKTKLKILRFGTIKIKIYIKNKITKFKKITKKVDYIILSPGVSLQKSKYKKVLNKYKKKIITDIDLVFMMKNDYKTIVVTGTNGKSTTCKIINHVLKKMIIKLF